MQDQRAIALHARASGLGRLLNGLASRESPGDWLPRGRASEDAKRVKRTRSAGKHRIPGDLRAGGPGKVAGESRVRHPMAAVPHDDEPEDAGEGREMRSSHAVPSDNVRRVARRRMRRISALAVVILASLALCGRAALSAQSGGAARPLKLGVPAYVFPGQPPLVTLQTMNPAPGIVILNPDNGDGPFNASWQAQADRLRAKGITVLGYVHTDDGSRPVADVETSIDNYLKPASGAPQVSGVFLDEMSTSCSAEPYYANLYRYIHSIDPAAFVAANPGTAVNVCFLRPGSVVANTFVTFEHDAATYISDYQGNIVEQDGTFSSGAQYPAATFWHLIYEASSSQMSQILSLAAARNAGYFYATDGSLPNPWDSVASYIAAEARAAVDPSPGQAGRSSAAPSASP